MPTWPEDTIILTSPEGDSLAFHPQGAHLLTWKPSGGQERLYMSEKAVFAQGVALRGGVPVIFPQFGPGPMIKHGFARVLPWKLTAQTERSIIWQLIDNEQTRQHWPSAFTVTLTAELSDQTLSLRFKVRNDGKKPLQFTAALHTYLAVTDVTQTFLSGLQGLEYLDEVTHTHHTDTSASISVGPDGFDLDRVYRGAAERVLTLDDLEIRQTNFPDTVVWNPGPMTGAKLNDLPQPNGWKEFLCVEAAAVFQPISLQPGNSWSGEQILRQRS